MLKKSVVLVLVLMMIASASAHVCNDVVSGSQVGCPDPETVEYVSDSASGNRITIVSDITAKHVEWKPGCSGTEADGCYDNDDYDNRCNDGGYFVYGFTVQSFVYSVQQGQASYLSYSSSPTTPYDLDDRETRRFNIYVDISPSAPSQHYRIAIAMRDTNGGTVDRPIYTLDFDWEAEGCSRDGDCSGGQICCDSSCVDPTCTQASDCGSNQCKTYTCNNAGTCSASCSEQNKADATACTGGYCCAGACDTTTGNTGFYAECRSGPTCVGSSWEYQIANNGVVCGGTQCTECNNGYCNNNDDSNCGPGETCNEGSCESGCTGDGDCSSPTPYCNTGTGECVQCLQASHCDDSNQCTTDTCSSNTCSNANVAAGTACTGGYCCSGVCDTTTGNTGFYAECRSGPTCVGSSWEYQIANNGVVCGGTQCTECNNGYCNNNDDSNCGAGEYCSAGTCVSSGCTSDSDCSSPNPHCETGSGQCVECLQASHCDDDNECTSDSCSSNTCQYTPVSDETVCDDGHCCDGRCDTTLGHTDFDDECRTGPLCDDDDWEYAPANDGHLCDSSECMECSSGYCSYSDDSRCSSGETCNAGTCSSTCADECNAGSKRCQGTTVQTCGDYDSDDCREWGSAVSCPDSICKEPSCANGVCDAQFVQEGGTDESCSGTTGCSGASCRCDGFGNCISGSASCTPNWQCTTWSSCQDGVRTRVCNDVNGCNTDKPAESESCEQSASQDSPETGTSGGEEGDQESLQDLIGGEGGISLIDILMWVFIVAALGGVAVFALRRRPHGPGPQKPAVQQTKSDPTRDMINNLRAKGYNDAQIKSAMILKGYGSDIINKYFK